MSGAGRGRQSELSFNGYKVSFGKMEKVLGVGGGDNCTIP